MIDKAGKEELIAELVDKIERAASFYLVDFTGLSVADTNAVRAEFSDAECEMKVAKNTLIRIALERSEKFDVAPEHLKGQTAVVVAYDNPIAPAKIIKKVYDKQEKLGLKLAIVEGQTFTGDQLNAVASLPTREDMIAGIVGSLGSPVSGIVGAVNGVIRDLSSVIEEVAKKRDAA